MTDLIKRCPFCGSSALPMRGPEGWAVHCNADGTLGDDEAKCGAVGPVRIYGDYAVDAWNARWDGGSGCHLGIANRADERLIVASPELLAACIKAAAKFRHYEDLHAAKGSLDGDAKARANAEMAEEIEAVIAKATPTSPTVSES